MKESQKNKNNNFLLFMAGAAIGAGAAYYLNTPSGKKMTAQAIAKGKDFGSNISDKAQSIADEAKVKANMAIENVNDTIASTKESILDQTNELLVAVEHKTNSFKKGIQKAKENLKNGSLVTS